MRKTVQSAKPFRRRRFSFFGKQEKFSYNFYKAIKEEIKMHHQTKTKIISALASLSLCSFGIAYASLAQTIDISETQGMQAVEDAISLGKCSVDSAISAAQCLNKTIGTNTTAPTRSFGIGDGSYAITMQRPAYFVNYIDEWPNFSGKWMTQGEKNFYNAIKATQFDNANIKQTGLEIAFDNPYKDTSVSLYSSTVEEAVAENKCTTPKSMEDAVKCLAKVGETVSAKSYDTDPALKTTEAAAYYAQNAGGLHKYATQEERNKMYDAIFQTQDTLSNAFDYILKMVDSEYGSFGGKMPTSLKEAAEIITDKLSGYGVEKAFASAAEGDPAGMIYLIQNYPDFAKKYVTMHEYSTILQYQANRQYDADKIQKEQGAAYQSTVTPQYKNIGKTETTNIDKSAFTTLSSQQDELAKISTEVAGKIDPSPAAWDDNGVDYEKTIKAVTKKAIAEGKCRIQSVQEAIDCVYDNYYTTDANGNIVRFDGGQGILQEFKTSKETHAENILAYICKGYPFMLDYANTTERPLIEKRMENLDMAHQADRIEHSACHFEADADESKQTSLYTSDCFILNRYLPGFKPTWIQNDSIFLTETSEPTTKGSEPEVKNPEEVPIASKIDPDKDKDKGIDTKVVTAGIASAMTLLGAAYGLLKISNDEKTLEKAEGMIGEAQKLIKEEKEKQAKGVETKKEEVYDKSKLQAVDKNDTSLAEGVYVDKTTGKAFKRTVIKTTINHKETTNISQETSSENDPKKE